MSFTLKVKNGRMEYLEYKEIGKCVYFKQIHRVHTFIFKLSSFFLSFMLPTYRRSPPRSTLCAALDFDYAFNEPNN